MAKEEPLKLWPVTHIRLIAPRIDDPYRIPQPNCLLKKCWCCGHRVFVTFASFDAARASVKTTNHIGFHIICLQCSVLYREQDRAMGKRDPVYLPPTPEQLKEAPDRILHYLNN